MDTIASDVEATNKHRNSEIGCSYRQKKEGTPD